MATGIARSVRVTREEDRETLEDTFLQYGHPPEDVARAILRGIEGRRLRVRVGIEAYGVDILKRLLPVGFHRWFAHRMRVPGS